MLHCTRSPEGATVGHSTELGGKCLRYHHFLSPHERADNDTLHHTYALNTLCVTYVIGHKHSYACSLEFSLKEVKF